MTKNNKWFLLVLTTCPSWISYGSAPCHFHPQTQADRAATIWDTASHHATVKREQGKAHTGFQSFFLEMTHGTSALTSLTKENPVYGHLLVQQGWDI